MLRRAAVALLVGIGLVAVADAGVVSGATRPTCVGRESVLVSVQTGAVRCDFPDVYATAAISDGHGGWFVGGRGRSVRIPGIAHLEGGGRLDRFWTGTMPKDQRILGGYAVVQSLALYGRRLYAAGQFGVEALSASTGKGLWLTPIKSAPGPMVAGPFLDGISTVAANSRAVFIDGSFATIDGVRYRDGLAALDPDTGRPLRWRGPTAKLPSPLKQRPAPEVISSAGTLALDGSQLLLGGAGPFEFRGKLRTGIFALNQQTGAITQWKASGIVGTSIFPTQGGPGDSVHFATHGTTLYRYEVDGAGNAAPTVYSLTATNTKTHRSLNWHPKLVSGSNGGGAVIAASAIQVFIG